MIYEFDLLYKQVNIIITLWVKYLVSIIKITILQKSSLVVLQHDSSIHVSASIRMWIGWGAKHHCKIGIG
jgi:hypothetical protein